MTYFVLASVKSDLDITDTGDDTSISTVWGPAADSEIDDILYETAAKNRKLESLPVLPLSSPPASIIDAANALTKERYYLKQKDGDQAAFERERAVRLIAGFVRRLQVDNVLYGRVVG